MIAYFILDKFLYGQGKYNKDHSYYTKLTRILDNTLSNSNLPKCYNFIINNLDEMRDKRNDIAHQGGCTNISKENMKKWMISVVLFYKYFQVIHNVD